MSVLSRMVTPWNGTSWKLPPFWTTNVERP